MVGLDDDPNRMTPEELEESELAYRHDLDMALGFIVSTPLHLVDSEGRIVWGQVGGGMGWSNEIFEQFSRDMESIVSESLALFPDFPDPHRRRPSHRYEYPPAAQSWPDLAIMLWDNAQPLMSNIELILSLSLGTREIYNRIKRWFDQKNQEIFDQNYEENEAGHPLSHKFLESQITLTQASIVALVVADTITRYGFTDPIRTDVYPRGFPGRSDPGHPDSQISYLVRCEHGPRVFVYHLDSGGKVLEHYLLSGSEITPLTAPDLWEENDWGTTGKLGFRLEIGRD